MRERMVDNVVFNDDVLTVSECMENAEYVINIESDDEPFGVNVGIGDSPLEAINDALSRLADVSKALILKRHELSLKK